MGRISGFASASAAHVAAGRDETARRGLDGRIDWVEGDLVALAPTLPEADVVTLDRVVCCYPAYEPLLEAALGRARYLVGFSYPRERWSVRAVMGTANGVRRLRGSAFRTVVHSPAGMAALLGRHGFRLVGRRRPIVWCIDLYVRDGAARAAPMIPTAIGTC